MDKDLHHIDTIISGCITGDRKSQEQLYKLYYKSMMSICLRYTKDETDAMSVLNYGFYKVFRNISSFDSGKGTVYTWIRTIVVRSCLDHLKIKEREIAPKELDIVNVEIEPEVISRIKSEEILAMVRKLPKGSQAVFNLYVMEGYGHKEIGQMLNISEGTSKWHFSEAKKKLKLLMQEANKNG